MKMNTLEKVRDCMKKLAPRIELPEEIMPPCPPADRANVGDSAKP